MYLFFVLIFLIMAFFSSEERAWSPVQNKLNSTKTRHSDLNNITK